MRNWSLRVGIAAGVLCLASTAALAGQGKMTGGKMGHKAAAKSAQAKCPVCGMFLAKSPTSKSTVAVRVNGKVMYCCTNPKCKMPASMLAKSSGGKMGKMGGKHKMGKM